MAELSVTDSKKKLEEKSELKYVPVNRVFTVSPQIQYIPKV